MRTIWWDKGKVYLINQRELPTRLEYVECGEPSRLLSAIKNLEIRGAPAIGVAAAMTLALAANNSEVVGKEELLEELEECAKMVRKTRPTAWNLFWATDRILHLAQTTPGVAEDVRRTVIKAALAIAEEDVINNRAIGTNGATLLEDGDVVGTICNAGWLATAGEYGTALGVVKVAHEQGKKISVIALETRPVLQGARLTAFELRQDGIEVKVIPDGAIGYCLSKGMIDKFICGADRIVWSSGCHVFNKIGTLVVSVVTSRYHVPFYVAAPFSTFDFEQRLEDVVIEERDQNEVAVINGWRIVPDGVAVINPAFDVTPPELVSAIITERGIIYPPFKENLRAYVKSSHR